MGIDLSAMVCVLFDAEGRYLRCIERFFSVSGEETDVPVKTRPFHPTSQGKEVVQKRFEAWLDETLATEEPITVQEFSVPNRFIAVASEPEHFTEPPLDGLSEAETASSEAETRRWRQARDFVFWWNEDYYCRADGTVHSH